MHPCLLRVPPQKLYIHCSGAAAMILCSSAALRQAALLCRADARPYRRPLVSARATRATGATTDESKASGGLKQRAAAALVAGALLLGSPDPALAGGASPLVSMLVTPAAITVEGFPTQLAMPAAAPETPELRPPKLRLPELQRPPQAPPRGGLPLPPPAGEDADVGQVRTGPGACPRVHSLSNLGYLF